VVEPEAYEKIRVAVPSGVNVEVNILPAGVNAKFLLIKASKHVEDPNDATKKLTYTVEGGTEQDLPGPLLMTDGAIVGLLGEDALSKVIFKNSMTEEVTVDILVCRDV
jgi:hypothetical protein